MRLTIFSITFLLAFSSMTGIAPDTKAAEPRVSGSITFSNEQVQRRFHDYRSFLESNPEKFAHELMTLRQLENSDVTFHVTFDGRFEAGIEGSLTTDGEKIFISVSHRTGNQGDVASLNSRLAHEFEHARQFDSGEIAFARNPGTREWAPARSSYDIGDEVKAWTVQLNASTAKDFWTVREGRPEPTLVHLFSKAPSVEEQTSVLARHGYSDRYPQHDCNVVFVAGKGFTAGQLIRPSRKMPFFGRVHGVSELNP